MFKLNSAETNIFIDKCVNYANKNILKLKI